jgi:hypothetical protein
VKGIADSLQFLGRTSMIYLHFVSAAIDRGLCCLKAI